MEEAGLLLLFSFLLLLLLFAAKFGQANSQGSAEGGEGCDAIGA